MARTFGVEKAIRILFVLVLFEFVDKVSGNYFIVHYVFSQQTRIMNVNKSQCYKSSIKCIMELQVVWKHF